MSCTGQELLAAPDNRLRRAPERKLQPLHPAQARVREGQAAIEGRIGQQLLVERGLIEGQHVRHTALALQDLAQLADDAGRVALPQPRHDQRRAGVIRQRDGCSNVHCRFRRHGWATVRSAA